MKPPNPARPADLVRFIVTALILFGLGALLSSCRHFSPWEVYRA